MDYEVGRCTRHCAATGRELRAGETFYSVLIPSGASVERLDYSTEAWQGPPERAIGWWRAQYAPPESKKIHWAPNDVMLNLLEELEADPAQADFRYVLALLLIRRRLLRLEETTTDDTGRETITVSCPRRETEYKIDVALPDAERIVQLQRSLSEMLTAGGSTSGGSEPGSSEPGSTEIAS